MTKTASLGFSLLLILAHAVPSLAQTQADADAAYGTCYNEATPQKKAEICEKYLADFKDGGPGANWRDPVLRLTISAYLQAQNLAKVIDVADRLPQLMPSASNDLKLLVYTYGMAAASQTNNLDKAVVFGEQVVAVDPNNVQALVTLATAIPARLPADEAGKEAALTKAMGYAAKALAQPKPQGVQDAQWQTIQTQMHTTMGFVHLNRSEWEQAASEYEQVVSVTPKDGVAQFRLGSSYQGIAAAAQRQVLDAYNAENAAITAKAEQTEIDTLAAKRMELEADYHVKRDKAIDALAKAVALGGEVGAAARMPLENLYLGKNNESLEGLEDLINQKKIELGVQ